MPRPLALPRSLVGVALSLLAVLFGVLTGILVKKLSTDVTLVTTIFYRFLFSLPIIFIVALVMRGWDWLHIHQRKTMCLRVFFGFCAMMFWFLSVRNMPFGLATSLFQSSVIFITLMSPFLLNEKVGIYRWSAVIAGLSGVVIITNPFSGAMTLAAFFGVGAALSSAVLAILLRRLGKGDVTIIASAFIAQQPLYKSLGSGANFMLLTLLREKWPVGSKAKFKIQADRVGAAHTYLAVPCGAVKIDDLADQNSRKDAETQQLAATLAFYKANRKRFANSSAVHGLIKQN